MRPGGKPKTVQMVRQGAANAASFLFEVTIKNRRGVSPSPYGKANTTPAILTVCKKPVLRRAIQPHARPSSTTAYVRTAPRLGSLFSRSLCAIPTAQHQAGVGATKTKAVREHLAQIGIAAGRDQGQIAHGRIRRFHIGRTGNKALLQHQQALNGFLHARCTLRMAGERFGGGEWRRLVAKHGAHGVQLGHIAHRG